MIERGGLKVERVERGNNFLLRRLLRLERLAAGRINSIEVEMVVCELPYR